MISRIPETLDIVPAVSPRMKIEIVPFDPKTASREEWARFHAYRRLRHEETDPEDTLWSDRTEERWMKRLDAQSDELRFAVVRVGRPETMIGSLYFSVFREDSPTYEARKQEARVSLAVLRPFRRQGIGRELLAKVAELAGENDRTLIFGHSEEVDGKAFVRAVNAQVAQRTRESRLYLNQVDWQMIEQWIEDGPLRSPDSTLHWHGDHIDEDIIEDFCRILTDVLNQVPRDELNIGDTVITPETIRGWEERIAESGGTAIGVVTREPGGELSGLTEMGYFPDEKMMIHQFMTGVRDVCRGRGLGKWLKAATLLRVREKFPQVEVVVTDNATSNAAMLSINERLGFRPHKEGVWAQITLEALEDYLRK